MRQPSAFRSEAAGYGADGRKPDGSSWDILGRALFASKRWEEAADLAERAIQATGDDYNVYVPYSNALEALGRTEATRALHQRQAEVLERQVGLVPGDTRAGMLLACVYSRLDRPDEAVRELQRVMEMSVTDPHTICNAACTYCMVGRRADALDTLRNAVEAGYSECESASLDPDLISIRDEPEFRRLIEAIKRR